MLIIFPVLAACTSYLASSDRVIGTWRVHAVNGEVVSYELYAKYSVDGSALAWPIPEGWGMNTVVTGKYYLTDTEFVLINETQGNMRVHYELKDDQLILRAPEEELVYIREKNPPLPGETKK